jgi:hypothetical protein
MLEGYLLFVDLSWNFVYRLRKSAFSSSLVNAMVSSPSHMRAGKVSPMAEADHQRQNPWGCTPGRRRLILVHAPVGFPVQEGKGRKGIQSALEIVHHQRRILDPHEETGPPCVLEETRHHATFVVAGADPVGKQADDGPGHMAAAVVHFMGKHPDVPPALGASVYRHEKCEGRPVRDDGIAADEPMAVHPAVFAAGRTAGRTAARKQFRPVCSGHLFLLKFFDGQSTLYGH